MTSRQYEELCRFFLADLFQIGIHQVLSMEMMNPARPNFPSYRHQIDLYWDIETEAARYLHIANAKFRAPPLLIDQRDVLLLQQVKTKVAAHKAVLITNVGFSEGALAAALDEGIALYLLRPTLDQRQLHPADPVLIQSQLQSLCRSNPSRPPFVYDLLLKRFPSPTWEPGVPLAASPEPALATVQLLGRRATACTQAVLPSAALGPA